MTFSNVDGDLTENLSLIESKRVYTGDVCVRLDKLLYDQKLVEEEVVEHSPSVGIIAVTDTDEIFLVLQYRHAIGRNLLEIPAGKIEKDESPEQAAVREMTEEIGYKGSVFPFIQLYLAPGYDTELMYIFTATDLEVENAIPDENERILVKRLKFTDAVKGVLSGKIIDSKTVASILSYWARSPNRK